MEKFVKMPEKSEIMDMQNGKPVSKMKNKKVFFVKVLRCSSTSYNYKKYIGKIVSVKKNQNNYLWWTFCPELPINLLCREDKNYSRKGFIYGVLKRDCLKL